jgi:SAM-dependent methyltransferase
MEGTMAKLSLWNILRRIGIPPRAWMRPNPFKVYEFHEVVSPSNLQTDHKVIDLGSGHGYAAWLLAERCASVIGIEPSQKAVEYAQRFSGRSRRKNVEFISTVLERAELPANSFDRIYSFCVLEHIENLETVLAVAYSILKPGGEMHVSVDSLGNISDKELIAKHKRDHAVHQYFTPVSIRQAFEAAGFSVMQAYPIMTGSFAGQEFEKRIRGDYGYGPIKRLLISRRLRHDDQHDPGESGIMLIARAKRPV